MKIEYLDASAASVAVRSGQAATEFVRVPNLTYAYSPASIYPLAPHTPLPLSRIVAFAVDMDGTSTTTEPLALHALEYMVWRIIGAPGRDRWPGLDPQRDHPYIIGNSNLRHVEVLLERYGRLLRPDALRDAFFEALLWTLANMPDPLRRQQIAHNARNLGLSDLLKDPEFQATVQSQAIDVGNVAAVSAPFLARYGAAFRPAHSGEIAAAALDIYYFRYHSILLAVRRNERSRLQTELGISAQGALVRPMPGYAAFVATVRGWLGSEAGRLYEVLLTELPESAFPPDGKPPPGGADRLSRLGAWFEKEPARLALVTASISWEAQMVMQLVWGQMAQEAARWPLTDRRREYLREKFATLDNGYDAFVTATEAHEGRLKPHPDLYSIALYQMSVPREDYSACVCLEDTEPGIVAARAAGFGCTVALPNRDTSRQDYRAATRVVEGGLPALLLVHSLLLSL